MKCPGCKAESSEQARFCTACGWELDAPEERDPQVEFRTSAGFVGRQQQLAALRSAVGDIIQGHGRLAMVIGEPGIGKTRTVQELAAYARTQGAQVWWGRCYEDEGTLPYRPWVSLIRSYAEAVDTDRLRDEMGPGAPDIAHIYPGLASKLDDLEPSPELETSEAARFRLFDSIASFIKRVSEAQPAVIVLDDLHWADTSSILLLRFLGRQIEEMRAFVIGCYRDQNVSLQHPLLDTMAEFAKEPDFGRHVLQGLTRTETTQYVEWQTGGSASNDVAEAIYDLTEGNPFFLKEVVALFLEQRQQINGGQGPVLQQVPRGVREAVGQRLNRRSQDCNRILTVAAVIGREFSLDLLTTVLEKIPEDALIEALEEAENAGMIEALSESPSCCQFTHALVRNTILGEISVARRAGLHQRIGQALEELYKPNPDVEAAALAFHFSQSLAGTSSEKMVHYSQIAGTQALERYAPEEALIHFQRALGAKEGGSMGSQTASLLVQLARAQLAVLPRAELHLAVENLTRAFDYYVEIDDADSAAEIAELPLSTGAGMLPSAGELITRALQFVPADSLSAGRLQVRYGWDLGRAKSDYEGAQEAFSQALAIAVKHGDSSLERDVLAASAEVDVFHLHCSEGLSKSLKAVELAQQKADPRAEIQARQRATLASTIVGDLEGAQRNAVAGLKPAEKLRDVFWWSSGFWSNQITSRLLADWDRARYFCDRSLEIHPSDLRILADRVLLEYEVGNLDEGRIYLERLLRIHREQRPAPTTAFAIPAVVIPLVSRIDPSIDESAVVKKTAESLLSEMSATPLIATMVRTGLAMLAVLQVDNDLALAQYNALRPQRRSMVQTGMISIDRVLGLLARTLGNPETAIAHFNDGLRFCRDSKYMAELAWTCHDYAETLIQVKTPGSLAAAGNLLDESASIASDLGLVPLEGKLSGLAEGISSMGNRTASPGGLSPREIEVLHLLAQGKSNRDIADELTLSSRTVAHHVTSILNKTGSSNRTEAASFAARHHLVSFEEN